MPSDQIADEYLDLEDDKVVSLYLSVLFWGMASQNPKTTPTQIGTVLDTAQKFHYYLRNP